MIDAAEALDYLEESESEFAEPLVEMLNWYIVNMNEAIDEAGVSHGQLNFRKDLVTEATSYIETLMVLEIV